MAPRRPLLCFAVLALVARPLASQAAAPATLSFVRDGKVVRSLDAQELSARCGAETIRVDDPYYGHAKSFRACPLASVLTLGFEEPATALAKESFLFRARDGYARPAEGKVLAQPGGYVAFADAERPPGEWEPQGRRRLDPGPFYVVWNGKGQQDPHVYPWPYQLSTIEIASVEQEFPHTLPVGLPPDAPAWAGYRTFRSNCIACHAINGEGGTVGPDLNVPRSIVEYRPRDQIEAYIRNPQSFRYTTMPAHESLTQAQLDGLIAYFEAMAARKHDPRSPKAP